MLVDFCHWSLQTTVTCDKPSSDGYEAQNLVSKDLFQQRKGFLASNFIKPPVNITFHFPCKISIHQILINPSVGAQKSTQIEIYTSCKKVKSSWLVGADSSDNKGKVTFDSPFFVNIGKVTLTDSSMICFTYPRFTASAPYSVERFDLNGYVLSELRNQRYQYLTAVSEMTIRIVRTNGSSVPALKSVQILGQPANSNGKDIFHKIYNLYKDAKYPQVTHVEPSPSKPDANRSLVDPGLQIPDEFIDPITCEIMALPMLLPCGKSLDQSTLERYISTESSWGRSASDPFTGVTFTAESRPIPNDSLKSRIDAFLLHNANNDQLKTVPRTVGRSDNIEIIKDNSPSVSSLTSNIGLKRSQKRSLEVYDTDGPQSKQSKIIDKAVDRKVLDSDPKQPTSQSKGGNSSGRASNEPNCSSHVTQLNNSLTDALSLLNHLPSFTKKSVIPVQETHKTSNVCVNCACEMDQSVASYALSCDHIVCRGCLVKSGSSNQTIVCGWCQRSSKVSEATRVHVT